MRAGGRGVGVNVLAAYRVVAEDRWVELGVLVLGYVWISWRGLMGGTLAFLCWLCNELRVRAGGWNLAFPCWAVCECVCEG